MNLPERIVHAAETAIDEARVCGFTEGNKPVYVEGYVMPEVARALREKAGEVPA